MRFDSTYLGPEGLNVEDQAYAGSVYAQVKKELFANAYYRTWGADGQPPLPVYGVTLSRALRGILPWGQRWQFLQAADRTLKSQNDMRWGPDGRGFRRLLHPNAVCLFGRWIIDERTEYTGHFQQGSDARIIARYSTCCTECRRGFSRSLSLVGKLFPNPDPLHPDRPVKTANFITQEDIGGARTLYMNDALLRNAPDTTPWRRGFGLPILLLTALAFKRVDPQPTIRQLYPIAELGKGDEVTRAPQYMQLRVAADQPRIPGEALDFREEVLAQLYERGTGRRKLKADGDTQALTFTIEVTDVGHRRGLFRQRREYRDGWRHIGRIVFDEAVASYNGDFVLHFQHPPWRENRNDPSTVVRRSGAL